MDKMTTMPQGRGDLGQPSLSHDDCVNGLWKSSSEAECLWPHGPASDPGDPHGDGSLGPPVPGAPGQQRPQQRPGAPKLPLDAGLTSLLCQRHVNTPQSHQLALPVLSLSLVSPDSIISLPLLNDLILLPLTILDALPATHTHNISPL